MSSEYWEDISSGWGSQKASGDAYQMVGIGVWIRFLGTKERPGWASHRTSLDENMVPSTDLDVSSWIHFFIQLFVPSFIHSFITPKAFHELLFSSERAPERFQKNLHPSGGFRYNHSTRHIDLYGFYRARPNHNLCLFNLFLSFKNQEMTRTQTSHFFEKVTNPGQAEISVLHRDSRRCQHCRCPKDGCPIPHSEANCQRTCIIAIVLLFFSLRWARFSHAQ